MALTIELSQEYERRLARLAAQQGRSVGAVARQMLEDSLTAPEVADEPEGPVPVQIPGLPPKEARAWLQVHGAGPVRFDELLGLGAGDDEDMDVDAFVAWRRQIGEEDLRRMEERMEEHMRDWDDETP